MTTNTVYSEFDVKVDGRSVSYGEVRYTFELTAGRIARDLRIADMPTVVVKSIEYRIGKDAPWIADNGNLFDFDVSPAWLISQVDSTLAFEAAE